MSLQIPLQQFNPLSSKALNPIANNNDNHLSSTERLNTSNNQTQQKQQALLLTPNSQNTQKSMTPQPHLQHQLLQVGLLSSNIYTNSSSLQSNNPNTSNMRFQKNLNSTAFNNHNNINNQQTQLIVHHQNSSSNNSESLCSDLRSFFQDNISGIHSQFTGTLSVNKSNNNNYSSIIQGSKSGSMNSNQHRIQVMTPSTNDDKSILSNNHFISTNPKQVDLSSSSQSHHNQHLLHSQVHSKNVSQTTQMSVFNNSGEISQFNYSSLGNNQNFQSQNQMSNISSVINNINFENDTLSSSQQQNTSISNISNTLQEARCRFHPYKKVKYQMSQNENEKFCTVCALEYAKQGLDVEPILKTQQKEINLFMNQMLNVKNINDMLMNSLDSKQEFIKEHSRKQSQIAQDLFLQIEKLIYEQKTQLLSQINNKMWEQINLIELKKNDSRLFEQKLLLKQQDIEKNYQQVTTQMGVSEVREILFFYNSELDQIKTSISDMFKNTSFDLINLNSSQIAQKIQILKKFLQEEVFKPAITQSTLQEGLNLLSNKSNSPSKNDKNQLSRLMSNQDKKGSGKKQQQQPQIQNKTLTQQLQNYQIEQSQIQPNVQKVIELNCAMNKLNSQNLQKQNQVQNEQMNFNQQKEQQQIFTAQIQQKQLLLQQQQQPQQQYNEIIDTSISEKQHTQESDDLSSAQGIYLNIQNQSKISNKSNISSHKIINYSDIHDEQNLNILKDSSSPSTSVKQIIRDAKATPITQEKKPFFPFQCISPQQTSKGEIALRQQYSISKDNQPNQKQKQFIQTEPTHLPSNKTKQGVSKQGNYQRNLLMNDEIATSNNRFKFNQNLNNNFSLLTHFNKQTNSNCQNLVVIPQNNNSKQQEQAQNFNSQSKLNVINNVRQLQINLVDQDSNQKSLTSRPLIMNQTNQNQQFVNSQNQQPNFVAQLIQQKQQQNTLKNTPNYQQLPNNDYNSLSSLKN
ncbi:hypothetical protein ABPG72_015179 [Tetrahymena utriculariae]